MRMAKKMELEEITDTEELEGLAIFVHGTLFGLHALSLFYNLARRNYKDATIHALAAGYDLCSGVKHYNYRNELVRKNEN